MMSSTGLLSRGLTRPLTCSALPPPATLLPRRQTGARLHPAAVEPDAVPQVQDPHPHRAARPLRGRVRSPRARAGRRLRGASWLCLLCCTVLPAVPAFACCMTRCLDGRRQLFPPSALPPSTTQEVVGINLANQTGREGVLSSAYADAVAAYASSGGKGFRLEPFDFHKQCGAANYGRLGLLWEARPCALPTLCCR